MAAYERDRQPAEMPELTAGLDSTGPAAGTVALVASHLRKRFPGVQALDDASLEVLVGEVHGVVGENGAGKSTLVQTLGGVHRPDSGSILRLGKPIELASPRDAASAGIQIVFQELSLTPQLTVAENVLPGREPTGRLGLINRRAMGHAVAGLIREWGFEASGFGPEDRIVDIPIAQQQMVEILKALAAEPSVLVFDEATSSLGSVDAQILFEVIRRLRSRGVAVIYISHDVAEVLAVSDRVTVMRDGRNIATARAADVDEDWVVTRMVGREIRNMYGERAASSPKRDALLLVSSLSDLGNFADCTFEVRAGEIVGLAGLVGAGRTELARAIAGHGDALSGSIKMSGTRVPLHSPRAAQRSGIAYVTEDRRVDGLFLEMPVWGNLAVHSIINGSGAGLVNTTRAKAEARELISRFAIATPSEDQILGRLSGGNQQKVLLAARLQAEPRLLIVDEPTRGVDIGAREEIYELLRGLAAHGVGILMVSSDVLEILGMSDRILVMRAGRLVAEFPRGEAGEDRIVGLATGAGRHAAYSSMRES